VNQCLLSFSVVRVQERTRQKSVDASHHPMMRCATPLKVMRNQYLMPNILYLFFAAHFEQFAVQTEGEKGGSPVSDKVGFVFFVHLMQDERSDDGTECGDQEPVGIEFVRDIVDGSRRIRWGHCLCISFVSLPICVG
jgi:hypothetical protein